MSDLSPPEANSEEPLQFDNAEFATKVPGRLTCTVCHREVENTYYEINGATVCESCRSLIESHRVGGSGPLRIAKATLFGSLAALIGFAIYFGIMKTTGMEIGLISILVGYMVGTAVRSGSGQRGGWVYQVLAILLTYSAISASYAATYLPILILAAPVEDANGNQVEPIDAPAVEPQAEPKPVAADKELADQKPRNVWAVLLSNPFILIPLITLSFKLPIILGLSSPIGLLIVGFALWEAGKLNRRVPLVFNGPFSFGGESAPPATELPSHA
ncbi:hypothetical protein SAMN05444166_2092 [Singulisphaera sp. GP187]|uniref:hypothetical protein n=1 Tax=Singulisphaera sp. GP187 TaxID=1882752 RepID=UPI0009267E08|nr:hypothetical protein [Singulisphaera sp. GP187]SIO02601.1 hypothetical protein SAMN05444166_2092 [Singulisphaera sp. GP187]